MANYPVDDYELAAKAVVGATQLGADYIKLAMPSTPPSPVQKSHLKGIIEDAPPVLLAGGDPSEPLAAKLEIARSLGMQGTCIGRHYFDRNTRPSALATVRSAFSALTTLANTCKYGCICRSLYGDTSLTWPRCSFEQIKPFILGRDMLSHDEVEIFIAK